MFQLKMSGTLVKRISSARLSEDVNNPLQKQTAIATANERVNLRVIRKALLDLAFHWEIGRSADFSKVEDEMSRLCQRLSPTVRRSRHCALRLLGELGVLRGPVLQKIVTLRNPIDRDINDDAGDCLVGGNHSEAQ